MSVDNAVFSILRAVELAHSYKNWPLYVLLLDWAKAYDKVNIGRMLKALRRLGVPQHFIDVLASLYRDPHFVVRDRFGQSKEEAQANGLRQGDGISCYLFICLLTVIMLDAEDSWIQTAEERDFVARNDVKNVLGKDFSIYADDSNLLNGCVRTIRCMLHSIQKEASYYGLFLNVGKAFLIRVGAAGRIMPVLKELFHGAVVQCVDFARTLGFDIGPLVLPSDTLRRRGWAMIGAMEKYKLVWTSDLPQQRKLERFDSLVVNKGIWGLHLLSAIDFSFLEYIYARCLRRILKIPAAFISRISHATVRSTAKVEPLQCKVRRRQMKLLGHILRRPPDHPDRLCLFEPDNHLTNRKPPDAVRRVGRPRTVWADTILPIIQKHLQLNRDQIYNLAQNREEWYRETERLCRLLSQELQA